MRFGFGILVHQTFYLSQFLLMLARGAAGPKFASEKPLVVLWMGFRIFGLGLLSGFLKVDGPRPFQKANRGAQQPEGPKPIEL